MDDWMNNDHKEWFTQHNSISVNDKIIEIFEFKYIQDDKALSNWAIHFRNHYCLDQQIDDLKPPNQSRKDYLNQIKLPNTTKSGGPSIRSGDFSEILVADYLQFILNYDVPRYRWRFKMITNESLKGSDLIGFHMAFSSHTPDDLLAIYEVKARLSAGGKNTLQSAINDSAKDEIRLAESLNFIKQQALISGNLHQVNKVSRFQQPTDYPYKEKYGAALVISDECCDINQAVSSIDITQHPKQDNLFLLVIRGSQMMDLAHMLYRRAADEA